MRKLFTILLSVVVVVSVSCNQPDYYTGVIIRKNHRLISRGRHVYGVVLMCKDGKHFVPVDETTYHKYNLGEVATLENITPY